MYHCALNNPLDASHEARQMLDELFRVLGRTGRLNITRLAREATSHGFPITRRQIQRWHAGSVTPKVDRVEMFARAVRVDWSFLYPCAGGWLDESVPYRLTDTAVEVCA